MSKLKAVTVFITVNALFLMIIKHAVLPLLEKQLEKSKGNKKIVAKIIVVGALSVVFNLSFTKFVRYPLSNLGLFVTVISALIGTLRFGKASANRTGISASPLSIPATKLETEATESELTAERERLELLETEADTTHLALQVRQQKFDEAQELFLHAQEVFSQTDRAISLALEERQDAEQAIIAAEEADRIEREAYAQKIKDLKAARDSLQTLLKSSGIKLSNRNPSQNLSLEVSVRQALEDVRQIIVSRTIPQDVINAVEHLSSLRAVVSDAKMPLERTKLACSLTGDRFMQTVKAVRDLQPNMSTTYRILNDATHARNKANKQLKKATKANDAAKEAVRIAREKTTAATTK